MHSKEKAQVKGEYMTTEEEMKVLQPWAKEPLEPPEPAQSKE